MEGVCGVSKDREVDKVSTEGIVLVDRDRKIIREIDRWRVCLGRHIRELAGFSGQRACDRRLRKLVEGGYIKREKILYGIAGIYRNTAKGIKIENLAVSSRKIRVEQIKHDIAVLDTVIFLSKKHGIEYGSVKSEIELHRLDGFGIRKHRPDFIFTKDGKTMCVEVELTLKARNRFEKIIKDNYMAYDNQIWIVPSLDTKIASILNKSKTMYSNIHILELSRIQGDKNDETS